MNVERVRCEENKTHTHRRSDGCTDTDDVCVRDAHGSNRNQLQSFKLE